MAFRRIVGLGLCVIDHLYVVDGLDLARTRTRFSERRVSMGGMVATALAQAASLGCNTHILSVLGDDVEGRALRRSLRAAGIKTGRLVLSSSLPTTVAVILVEQRTGERRFVVPDRRPLERPRLPVRSTRMQLLPGLHHPSGPRLHAEVEAKLPGEPTSRASRPRSTDVAISSEPRFPHIFCSPPGCRSRRLLATPGPATPLDSAYVRPSILALPPAPDLHPRSTDRGHSRRMLASCLVPSALRTRNPGRHSSRVAPPF